MAILRGCEEKKYTPKLVEIECPNCKESIEVFVRLNGGLNVANTLLEDAACTVCGYVAKAGTKLSDYKEV